jgi:hypothetical protein
MLIFKGFFFVLALDYFIKMLIISMAKSPTHLANLFSPVFFFSNSAHRDIPASLISIPWSRVDAYRVLR